MLNNELLTISAYSKGYSGAFVKQENSFFHTWVSSKDQLNGHRFNSCIPHSIACSFANCVDRQGTHCIGKTGTVVKKKSSIRM